MSRFLLRRLPQTALSVWGIATVIFFLMQVIPGDPARIAAGRTATPEQVEAARQRLGLDLPILEQYLGYLGRLLHGDLGTSVVTFQPITADLADVLPPTLELVLLTMLVNLCVAVPLGVVAAVRQGRAADTAIRVIVVLGGGVPVFWLGLMLQYLVGTRLGLLPISGRLDYGMDSPVVTGFATVDALLAGNTAGFGNAVAHLILPAIALSAPFLATVARGVRSTLMGTLASDYVVFARAKGGSTARVVVRHALRSALTPTLTIVGLQFGWMLGAALLVESVFGLTGLGTYLSTAVTSQDTFAVLGTVLVIGVVFVFANLLVDLCQLWLDPRVRADA
ncbi:peptide/nickel transport system permease protein [Actinocorallia herbida]|uniref:Peptide/nickel transport system permease protein n=1 Tax=Actinocorallia herbida TaxID=58109 RepID=A0A3N1D1Q7_9ACTN|nr:ABC transporter permease [Actinocorallia herbida]ROO86998.1 peptide/nickel transport system permease protein [Actinocorallia herbida]